MLRAYLLGHAFLRLVLAPQEDVEGQVDADGFYIGLGDQFDDDRRIVRGTVSTPCQAAHLTTPRCRSSYPLARETQTPARYRQRVNAGNVDP